MPETVGQLPPSSRSGSGEIQAAIQNQSRGLNTKLDGRTAECEHASGVRRREHKKTKRRTEARAARSRLATVVSSRDIVGSLRGALLMDAGWVAQGKDLELEGRSATEECRKRREERFEDENW